MKSLIRSSYLLGIILSWSLLPACQSDKTPTQDQVPAFDEAVYLEKGKAITAASFAALSGKLQIAMQEGGVPKAIEYCQLKAYPLTDSLSKAHQASIRRTSTRVRNPLNLPTAKEKVVLKQYEEQAKKGEVLVPIAKAVGQGQVAFYAPIKVNAFCLQCHGKVGETLSEEHHAIIKERYPEDKAIGFQDGDLRGMWSISFNRVQEQE